MELKLRGTNVFERNYSAYRTGTRNVVNQGGSRSSKTYSIAQVFLIALYKQNNTVLSICRKTLPSLRGTAMRDFFDIMRTAGAYRVEQHNKSDLIYRVGSNEVEFISVDQPQKIRGRKRKLLWMNEANEFSLEDYRQLNMRTTGQVFMDFNPSDQFHWIYDEILPRDDTTLIKSTYKDNPFLEQTVVKEIERYETLDQNYWRIYGLGERGVSEVTIYTHWELKKPPEKPDETIYGLDFGYNNPSSLVRIDYKDQNRYWTEMLYESHLTNQDLITRLGTLGVNKTAMIYCDSAEPARIEELRLAGYNVRAADKDVRKGIDTIKTHTFYINPLSVNIQKEVKSYLWKEKDGKPLDEPVKANDHALDAGRYADHTHTSKPPAGFY